MTDNIISAIFSPSSQSLCDRFHITNRENICLLLGTSLLCAKNKSEVSAHAVLFKLKGLNKTDLQGRPFMGTCYIVYRVAVKGVKLRMNFSAYN